MKDFTNSHIALALNEVRTTILNKIEYEELYEDTDKVRFSDGAHNGYVQGLADSCIIIGEYIKQISKKS
tara:strand:- start:360 stop:566 length:207 start_codon:yes stop_codon:yes gene_type:complete